MHTWRAFVEEALARDPRGFGALLDVRIDEAEGAAYAVTDAGQKVRVRADGSVELLMGPDTAGPEIIDTTGPLAAAALTIVETAEVIRPESPPLPPADPGLELDRVERFPGADGQWYFHGVARNGEIVYPSEGYASKRNAGRPARSLADRFGVDVVDLDHDPRA